jgi:hypothetical protein
MMLTMMGIRGGGNIIFNDKSNTTDVPLTSTESASGKGALGTDVARGGVDKMS